MAAMPASACLLLGLAVRGAAIAFDLWPDCPPDQEVVASMQEAASDAVQQTQGCTKLAACIDSSNKAAQDRAAAAGAIEVAVDAMRKFPENKGVQVACTAAVARPILFNRENGLRAGRLGGLNLTLAAYARWMDDPVVTSMGGDIGAYFDYVDENRAIARELGGIGLLIQNIKNNFHGRYSNWKYFPVLNSLYGLSSGCWRNQDICFEEGFPDLAVQLMNEHTSDVKIAEESLQAVKALMAYSDSYRQTLSEKGLAEALVKVLQDNPHDRGAVTLACESMSALVGPTLTVGPPGTVIWKAFDAEIQANATQAGAVQQLLATVVSGAERRHFAHEGFNFDVDAAYNADASCLDATRTLVANNPANRATMLQAGLGEYLAKKLQPGGGLDPRTRMEACYVSQLLGEPRLAVLAAAGMGACFLR